jgi:hypothetical protein
VFMVIIFARFTEETLNVSSGTAVALQRTPVRHHCVRCSHPR